MGNSAYKSFPFGRISQRVTGYFTEKPASVIIAVKPLGSINFPEEGSPVSCHGIGWRREVLSLAYRAWSQLWFGTVAGLDFDLTHCVYLGLGSWAWTLCFFLSGEWSSLLDEGWWARGPINFYIEFHWILPFSAHSYPPQEKHPLLAETSWVLRCEPAHSPGPSPHTEGSLLLWLLS